MEYVSDNTDIEESNIIFKLPIKNQNDNYCNFYKILYSTNNFTLKYLLVKFNFDNIVIKEESQRFKLVINKNDKFISNIRKLEIKILNAINNTVKKKVAYNLINDIYYKPYLYSFLHYPNLKHFYIKISGIWENEESIGLVYKFYYNTSTEKLSNIIC